MAAPFTLPIQVVEAGRHTAWLVEDHTVPVVSLAWSWPGSSPRCALSRQPRKICWTSIARPWKAIQCSKRR